MEKLPYLFKSSETDMCSFTLQVHESLVWCQREPCASGCDVRGHNKYDICRAGDENKTTPLPKILLFVSLLLPGVLHFSPIWPFSVVFGWNTIRLSASYIYVLTTISRIWFGCSYTYPCSFRTSIEQSREENLIQRECCYTKLPPLPPPYKHTHIHWHTHSSVVLPLAGWLIMECFDLTVSQTVVALRVRQQAEASSLARW